MKTDSEGRPDTNVNSNATSSSSRAESKPFWQAAPLTAVGDILVHGSPSAATYGYLHTPPPSASRFLKRTHASLTMGQPATPSTPLETGYQSKRLCLRRSSSFNGKEIMADDEEGSDAGDVGEKGANDVDAAGDHEGSFDSATQIVAASPFSSKSRHHLSTSSQLRMHPPDRFLPNPHRHHLPLLDITPRTERICRRFGLVESDRTLSYSLDADKENASTSTSRGTPFLSLLQKSASVSAIGGAGVLSSLAPLSLSSGLTNSPTNPPPNPCSVLHTLAKRKACTLTLDSPGITQDTEAYPIAWSSSNLIAVACYDEIYYQNLETKVVVRVGSVLRGVRSPTGTATITGGGIQVLSFDPTGAQLVSASRAGLLEVWDTNSPSTSRRLRAYNLLPLPGSDDDGDGGTMIRPRSLAWKTPNVLYVGADDGSVRTVDTRVGDAARCACVVHSSSSSQSASNNSRAWSLHRSRVASVHCQPSGQGTGELVASGDRNGYVKVWDARRPIGPATAGAAQIGGEEALVGKMRIGKGCAKAIAWCPWAPLLATADASPQSTIQIWSLSSSFTGSAYSSSVAESKSPFTKSNTIASATASWMTKDGSNPSLTPTPTQIINLPLHTATYALQWSESCKELLSTHGASYPVTVTRRRPTDVQTVGGTRGSYIFRSHASTSNAKPMRMGTQSRTERSAAATQLEPPKPIQTALSNSILVHSYPKLLSSASSSSSASTSTSSSISASTSKGTDHPARLLTLTNAHGGPVTQACLSPCGGRVFTVCPKEEVVKMWEVWNGGISRTK